jgi:hypothetical protein
MCEQRWRNALLRNVERYCIAKNMNCYILLIPYIGRKTMNIQVSKKTFMSSLLTALVTAIIAGSFGQNAIGQTAQDQNAVTRANITSADFNAIADNLVSARLGILRQHMMQSIRLAPIYSD